eukprot:CAMPEP_0167780530 /NCGR_PEP_ID=MMETSP0111_2-20121227/5416_1 /TAXON_ID=91324 /ORGANISM="Lotharella globosa, Strain CCCM811" /LENGTH=64 /DNA_ID=CAMNT_0007671067 /DNA_START=793 /DNA_END=987 /DNA_ORIENTATION=+
MSFRFFGVGRRLLEIGECRYYGGDGLLELIGIQRPVPVEVGHLEKHLEISWRNRQQSRQQDVFV